MKNVMVLIGLLASVLAFGQFNQLPGVALSDASRRFEGPEKALEHLNVTLLQDPNNVMALVKRSELYAILGMGELSLKDMDRALSINPYAQMFLSPKYRQSMFPSKYFKYLGQDETKDQFFDKSFVIQEAYMNYMLDDTVQTALDNTLDALVNADYDDAERYLNEVKVDGTNEALYYDIRGVLALKQQDYNGAIAFFDKAISVDPEYVLAYHNRAIAYKNTGDLDMAEADFENALYLNSDISKIHFSKGLLHEMKGEDQEAKKYYQNAMSKRDYYPEAKSNYAVLLKSTGEYASALNEINELIQSNSALKENYYTRAGIYLIYGEYSNAIKDFDEFLRGGTDGEADALFYRGVAKLLSNQYAEGCTDLQQSVAEGYDRENIDLILYMCD